MFMFALLVVAAAAVYFMTPEERMRLVRAAAALLRRLMGEAARLHAGHRAAVGENGTPRARAIVTPALSGAVLAAFVWIALAPGGPGDPSTLIASGANFGPRTTNGEWWRLVTAGFLHARPLGLLINLAALLQVSLVLERVVGRVTIVAVYVLAGVFAGLVSLSVQPMAIAVGASAGIFGLYGLLLASWMWGVLDGSRTVRLPVVAGLAPGALVFVLYQAATGELLPAARIASVVTGLAGGVPLARGVRRAPALRMAATFAAAAVVAVMSAVPLRGLTDIRPHIAHLVTVENDTAAAYDEQVARFRNGRTSVDALASLIERQVLPQLQAAAAPLKSLDRVPDAHQPLHAAARRFVELRVESWQLRLRGLRKASMPMLRDADAVEGRSRELLRQVLAVQSSAS